MGLSLYCCEKHVRFGGYGQMHRLRRLWVYAEASFHRSKNKKLAKVLTEQASNPYGIDCKLLDKLEVFEGTKDFCIHSDCDGYWSYSECENMLEAYKALEPFMPKSDKSTPPPGVAIEDFDKMKELIDMIEYCAENGLGYVIQFA